MTESEQMHYAAIAYGGYIDDANSPGDEGHGLRRGYDGVFYVVTNCGWVEWTPRTDNGQAFELAMRAGIAAHNGGAFVSVPALKIIAPVENGDIMAAAREAVFLAAVEIGKDKK